MTSFWYPFVILLWPLKGKILQRIISTKWLFMANGETMPTSIAGNDLNTTKTKPPNFGLEIIFDICRQRYMFVICLLFHDLWNKCNKCNFPYLSFRMNRIIRIIFPSKRFVLLLSFWDPSVIPLTPFCYPFALHLQSLWAEKPRTEGKRIAEGRDRKSIANGWINFFVAA